LCEYHGFVKAGLVLETAAFIELSDERVFGIVVERVLRSLTMKSVVLVAGLLLFGCVGGLVAESSHPDISENARAIKRGPHQTVYEVSSWVTNEASAHVFLTTNRFTLLETGLNRLVGTNWVETSDGIALVGDGAESSNTLHHVRFESDIDTEGAVTITTSDGKVLRTRILGLG
jgi:hypothetical protein